jgi:outer membrane protein assembly factor BamB
MWKILLSMICLEIVAPSHVLAESWPQFRGVNGSAKSVSQAKLPTKIGPKTNVAWKTALPPGHSSPVVFGDQIYLTAVRESKLVTISLLRSTGAILWEKEAAHDGLEEIHTIGSHAQPTPATDGKRVVSFFGSCGLFCYDTEGNLLWQRRMGPFNNDFGAATSPMIVDDWVVLCQDHDTGSFLMAIDKTTGKTVWKTDRSEFPRNFCTPVIAEVKGRKQIVVAATLRVVGYDFQTGKEVWTVRGIARAACASPGLGDDGTLYFASYAGGGEPGSRIQIEPFQSVAKTRDTNKNGQLEKDELEGGGPIHRRFTQVDRDNTNTVSEAEWEYFRKLFKTSRNSVVAIKPGGQGDVTKSHVQWEFTKFVPFIASPVSAGECLFNIKDGGILTSLDLKTGQATKTQRLDGTGAYYSSPVFGDGKVYLVNMKGELAVVSATKDWQVLSTSEFGEEVYATPAIVDGSIYLRTSGHLYCFQDGVDQASANAKKLQPAVGYKWVNVTNTAAYPPCDGAGALVFKKRMWLLGGWNPSDKKHFPRICNNAVWSSTDGAKWTLEKPNTFLDKSFDTKSDWEGRHTAGYAVHQNKIWIVGGDVNQGHYQNDVWNSSDGKKWTLIDNDVQWGPRSLHYTVAFKNKIWVMGGQTMPAFGGGKEKFYRDIWTSSDGIKWDQVKPQEPLWSPRGMIGGSVVFQDRIWILGGGTYDTPTTPKRNFYNDVWSSADGVNWKRHTNSAAFPPRQYHDVAVFDGRMWVFEGYHRKGGNRNDVWHSDDGVNWHELPNTPWKPRHAASVFVYDDALWMVAGNNMQKDVWKLVRTNR